MKQSFLAIVLALSMTTGWASEQGDDAFFNGEKLYGMCSQPLRDGECVMFLAGTLQGMGVQAYMNNTQDDCIPLENRSINDVKNIVVGYLAQNKELFPYPAASSVVLALGTDDCKTKLMLQQ